MTNLRLEWGKSPLEHQSVSPDDFGFLAEKNISTPDEGRTVEGGCLNLSLNQNVKWQVLMITTRKGNFKFFMKN